MTKDAVTLGLTPRLRRQLAGLGLAVLAAAPVSWVTTSASTSAASASIPAPAVTGVPEAPIASSVLSAATHAVTTEHASSGGVSGATVGPALPVPARGGYLGAWWTPAAKAASPGNELALWVHGEPQVGRPLALLSVYQPWTNPLGTNVLSSIAYDGSVPFVSWACGSAPTGESDADINLGHFDTLIANYGAALAGYGYPVMLRWYWEPNLHGLSAAKRCLGAEGAAGYVAVWQRIHLIFQMVGATNVSFVWNPSSGGDVNPGVDQGTGRAYPGMMDFYPGDNYVDWKGFDAYDGRLSQVLPHDFSSNSPLSRVRTAYALQTTQNLTINLFGGQTGPGAKPLIIGETGAPSTAGQDVWLNDINSYMNGTSTAGPNAMPLLKGLVYFNAVGGNFDYSLGAVGLPAFTALAHSNYFAPMPPQIPSTACAGAQNQPLSGQPRQILAMSNGKCSGYWVSTQRGEVTVFGSAGYYGDVRTLQLNAPIIAMAATPDDGGYWLLGSDGGVFAFGDAFFYGSTGNLKLNAPVVGIASSLDGGGYWLVASDGGIFAFGDAVFSGSTGGLRLNRSVVGMAASSDGGGYWLVATDGGIFAFGDAPFLGSTGGSRLNAPVIAMTGDPAGTGYRLVASDGGMFTFGAPYFGSLGGTKLGAPIVAMTPTFLGDGYYMLGADGGVFAFGNAPYLGRVFAG